MTTENFIQKSWTNSKSVVNVLPDWWINVTAAIFHFQFDCTGEFFEISIVEWTTSVQESWLVCCIVVVVFCSILSSMRIIVMQNLSSSFTQYDPRTNEDIFLCNKLYGYTEHKFQWNWCNRWYVEKKNQLWKKIIILLEQSKVRLVQEFIWISR